jgi:hypothetical protein
VPSPLPGTPIRVEHAIGEQKKWRPPQRYLGRREYFPETQILAAGWPHALVRPGIRASPGETGPMQKGCPSMRGTPSDLLLR